MNRNNRLKVLFLVSVTVILSGCIVINYGENGTPTPVPVTTVTPQASFTGAITSTLTSTSSQEESVTQDLTTKPEVKGTQNVSSTLAITSTPGITSTLGAVGTKSAEGTDIITGTQAATSTLDSAKLLNIAATPDVTGTPTATATQSPGGLLSNISISIEPPDLTAQEDTPEPNLSSTPAPTTDATITPTPQSTIAASADEMAVTDMTSEQWLGLIISFVVILVVAHFLGILLVWMLRRVTRKTETKWDDDLLRVIRPQISWLFAALGFQIATLQLPLDETLKTVLNNVYFVLYWFVIMATLWRTINFFIIWYSDRLSPETDQALSERALLLLERLGKLVLVVAGGIILLAHFGINMLAVSAALGLSGFAIALAAKDTITNLISGIVIMVDHPFTIGDRIDVPELDTWGDVVEIGMRTTKVITRDNREVIIPNSAIVDNNVVNYSQPDPTYRLQTDIGIGSGEDIGKVVRILKNTVENVEGVLDDKPVDILFIGFGDSSNTFRVRWWVHSYTDKRNVTHKVCSAIQETATKEGIDIPLPTYALDGVEFPQIENQDQPGSTTSQNTSAEN